MKLVLISAVDTTLSKRASVVWSRAARYSMPLRDLRKSSSVECVGEGKQMRTQFWEGRSCDDGQWIMSTAPRGGRWGA